MGDFYIKLIPTDPNYVPGDSAQQAACKLLTSLALDADEVTSTVYDGIQFIDAGENFESIKCSACGSEISLDWWSELMGHRWHDEGFQDLEATLPCCGITRSLNDLNYHFPQGFARFVLEAMNSDSLELEP